MNKIGDTDTIFDFESKHTRAFSYYGWELNNSHAFYNYMIGYKKAADAAFEAFREAFLCGDNEVEDTVCYPLIYLYRHMTELLLKYSFVELKSNRTKEEITSYLNIGHDLQRLWNGVKQDYERLSKRTGIDVDIAAINHYINELSLVDSSSMAYRYPINKKLDRFHHEDLRLNMPKLKDRMDAFYDYMTEVVYQLSKHLEDDEYDSEFDKCFCSALMESLNKIKEAFAKIEGNIEEDKQNKSDDVWLKMSDIDTNSDKVNAVHQWINSFSETEKSILLLLYYTGRQIPENRLAIEPNERHKDVIKLLYGNAHDEFELDSQRSFAKDEAFEMHIAYGNRISLNNIKLTLEYLGVTL